MPGITIHSNEILIAFHYSKSCAEASLRIFNEDDK